jgi:RNA polymerase sigma-70 factor (ECF subfamily)
MGKRAVNADFLRHFLIHQSDLKAYIGSVIRDRSLRDDVFQDTALSLWESFDRFDSEKSFGAWARGVAIKKILQQHRKTGRIPLATDPQVLEAILEAFDQTAHETNDRQQALQNCLEKLPEKSREILALRYEESVRGEEIASRLSTTRDAVYQSLARIRTKLESCIRKQLPHH